MIDNIKTPSKPGKVVGELWPPNSTVCNATHVWMREKRHDVRSTEELITEEITVLRAENERLRSALAPQRSTTKV